MSVCDCVRVSVYVRECVGVSACVSTGPGRPLSVSASEVSACVCMIRYVSACVVGT